MSVPKKQTQTKSLTQIFNDYCDNQDGCPSPEITTGCEGCMVESVKLWLKQKGFYRYYTIKELLVELEEQK